MTKHEGISKCLISLKIKKKKNQHSYYVYGSNTGRREIVPYAELKGSLLRRCETA